MSAYSNPAPSPVEQPDKLAPVALPAPPEKKGGSWKGLVIAALIVVGGWAAYEFGYKRSIASQQAQAVVAAVPTVKVASGSLEVRTRVAGGTAAREYVNVTAPMIRGPEGNRPMVLLKLAPSGSMIKKGELVAQIDGQSVQDHIDDVKDTVETAEADVRKREAELEIDWKNMQQTLAIAKADYDKARLDAKASEVRTEVERMLLQLTEEEALARYKQLQSDIENTKRRNESDIKILKYTLERHRRHLDRHAGDMAKFAIRAAIDGLVVYQSTWGGSSMRQIEIGDQVAPGQAFMKIVNPTSMMLDARINQAESERFKLNQAAVMRIEVDAGGRRNPRLLQHPAREIETVIGELRHIGVEIERAVDRQEFVEADPGQSVEQDAAVLLVAVLHRVHLGAAVERRRRLVGPNLAESRNRAIDQPRILGPQRVGADAELVHDAGAEVLDDDVRLARQLIENVRRSCQRHNGLARKRH